MDADAVRFGRFRLDLRRRELSYDERPIKLGSRALDILCTLVAAEGEIVTKDELMARAWPGVVVEENALQVHVSALRKALEEGKSGQGHIVTVQGRGYRLVGLQPQLAEPVPDVDVPPGLPLPDRPSIAVLPFQNMSGDPEQQYFADGIVEDIITGLSRIRWFFVIARNSSFVFREEGVDVRRVGRELGVRYVLEGSVRKAGSRVRISAQLVETETGAHVWAERYDRLLDDIFALQDDITVSVVGAIEPSLRKAEMERIRRKRPDNLDAYDLVLRALPSVHKAMTDGIALAIPLLQKALELEPDYALAHAHLARCFHVRFSRGGMHEDDRAASIFHARAAITGAEDDATTLATAALVIWFDEHDMTTAFDLFDRALAVSNSNVVALGTSAFALAWMGQTELAIERAQHALRLSPFDALLPFLALAVAHFHAERYDNALDAARRAVEASPTFSVPHVLVALALVRLGRGEEAKVAGQRVLALDPTFTAEKWSVTVGAVPAVFAPFALAWRQTQTP